MDPAAAAQFLGMACRADDAGLHHEALRAHEHLWARAATFIGRSAADAAKARDVTRKWAGAVGGMRGAIANYDAVERALEGAGLASLLHVRGHRRRSRR